MAADNTDKLLNAIKKPDSISDRDAGLAKAFAKGKMMEGFTVGSFCKEHSVSTKTWYELLADNDFKAYLSQIQAVLIPDDERQAYEAMKKHLLKIPYLQNPTPKQIEIFMDVFSYVVEADKRDRMDALGIADGNKPVNEKTVDEKKAILLSRLKG